MTPYQSEIVNKLGEDGIKTLLALAEKRYELEIPAHRRLWSMGLVRPVRRVVKGTFNDGTNDTEIKVTLTPTGWSLAEELSGK